MSVRILVTNAFWSLLSHSFSRGSLMLSGVLLARSLNTSDFAAYSYFQLTVSMIAAYAGMGLGVTASRYFAVVGYEKQNQETLPLGVLWGLSICFAFIASLCIFLVPADWLSAGFVVPRWLLALGVFVLALQIVPGGAILGLEKYKQATIVSVVSGVCILLGSWLAVKTDSAVIAMASLILASTVQLLGESMVVIRVTGWARLFQGGGMQWSAMRQVLGFAGPMLLVSLLAASGTWLLGRLIAGAGGDHSFALYSIGMQWFALALVLPGMVSRVILPRVVRNIGSTFAEKKALVSQGAVIATLTAAVIFIIGVLFSQKIMSLYGSQYSDYRWLVVSYLAAAVLIAPANTLGNAIVADNGQRIWFLVTTAWLVTLLLAGFLTRFYGAWSGAIALGTAAFVLTTLATFVARSKKII